MADSPFSTVSANLAEMGLAIMPCGPGTKFPGRYSAADGWTVAYDWQKYCERLPTGFETGIWDRWPDAGVCLALGRSSAPTGLQLMAVDIDTDEPEVVAAIRSVLPGSPVRKRGAKGETEFYLAPTTVPNRPYNDADKVRLLDLLGHGRQTVLPPTIHPGIGQPYAWTTLDTLESFPVADLPVLPEDIADRLGAALAPFGHVDPPKRGEADPDAEASTHRQLNDSALANLSAWVPGLNLYKCRQVGGKFKAVATWRPSSSGRPMSQRATNLIISPDGIKDKGAEETYTPLDLVMAACECSLDTAFRWLQERVAPAPAIVLTAKVRPEPSTPVAEQQGETEEPALIRTSPKGNLAGLFLATVDGEPVSNAYELPVATIEQSSMVQASTILDPEVCCPPGLLGDMVQWMNDSAARPLPQLNLGAAIGFLGAIMGRRFESPTRARTNFYLVGLAPTGRGKNHPLDAIGKIAEAANIDEYLGPESIKSETAVRKLLEARPTVTCMIDEMGGFMRKILNKRASTHEAGIRDIMLSIFSKANMTYRGAEGAAEKAQPIYSPNLGIFGATTPEDLWGQFTSGNADDGFLPRWIVLDAGPEKVRSRTPIADVTQPPPEFRARLHAILDMRKGNLNGVAGVDPIRCEWGAGAAEMFAAMQDEMDDRGDAAKAAGRFTEQKVMTRFAEHCVKLAVVYAVGIDCRKPVVTVAALEWARSVMECSARALIEGIEGRVADNEYQAAYLLVLSAIREAGPDGILTSALVKRLRGKIRQRELDEILGQLQRGGEVWKAIKAPPGGGRPGERYGAWGVEREAG